MENTKESRLVSFGASIVNIQLGKYGEAWNLDRRWIHIKELVVAI